MRKKLRIVAVALLCVFAFGACAREAKVIPARKMARIYREMLLADQWLADNPEKKTAADTTWFYEPIFEKYGYTLKDYQNSVDHYLNDPKRYAQMMAKVGEGLRKEASAINQRIGQRERSRFLSDSLARARKKIPVREFQSFVELYPGRVLSDSICFSKDSVGVYSPIRVILDTMFLGPELIIRDSAEVVAKVDSASVFQADDTPRLAPFNRADGINKLQLRSADELLIKE